MDKGNEFSTVSGKARSVSMVPLAALLALTSSGLGCARDARPPAPAASPAPPLDSQNQPAALRAALPAALIGVWYRDDAAGRARCDRYLALPEDIGETEEGLISMVGSVVITPTLIHECSEHGEGNFNAIKEITSFGDDSWRVKVHAGIDSMPADEADLEIETNLLELKQGRLSWEPRNADGRGAHGYFRCESARSDLYQEGCWIASGSKEFPAEVRGRWMLGPEPCYLPMNADADGQLTITRKKMYGYEDTYDPVRVSTNSDAENSWDITISEQLGDQRHASNSVFTLRGDVLSIKYDEKYTEMYVRCMEKHDD